MLLIDIPSSRGTHVGLQFLHRVAARAIFGSWMWLKCLPFLMSIGIGLSVNNTRAVLSALQKKRVCRTRNAGSARQRRMGRQEIADRGRQALIELALGFTTGAVFYALINQIYGTLPFLMLFQIGFLYTGLLSILQQFTGDER